MLIRLLVVDDHPVVRSGLVAIIGRQPGMEVAAQAVDGFDAVEKYFSIRPNVCLMDLSMPGMDGWDAMAVIRARDPRAKIIAVSSFGGDEDIHRALAQGASGYLFKDATESEIAAAVRAVATGLRHLPPGAAQVLSKRLAYHELSERELEVIEMAARGLSNKDIASQLSITESTIKGHMSRILTKLDATDRTGAVRIAIERGLIRIRR